MVEPDRGRPRAVHRPRAADGRGADRAARVPRRPLPPAGGGAVRLLLLHGIGGGRAIWAPAVAAFGRAGVDARAIDFPGYGAAPGRPTMDAMVAAAAAEIDRSERTGAGPVVVVGHSMGGLVAQELVARRAAPVRALVLACTSASFGSADGAWQARFVAERLAPLQAGLGMAGLAAALVSAMVAPAADRAVRAAAAAVMAGVPEASYRTALAALAAFDRRAALPAIGVPTLCLAAAHDRTAPPAMMQRMAQRIPGAEFLCLAGAGHIAPLEQPGAFAAAVLDFLQRRLAPPQPPPPRTPCTSPATPGC
ncbi:MAG: alpha/beta fold hydrolase [Burkholderiales bacterium]|nr:alpha/beta fold hydrolase [Burkholderiales bacterium]